MKKIEGLEKKGFKGLKSIVDKTTNEVFGHYTYYRQESNLAVDFLDTDLNVTKHITIGISANSSIDEGIYNGESLLFLITERGLANAYTLTPQGERISSKVLTYAKEQTMSVFPSVGDNCYYIVLPAYEKMHSGYKVQKVDVNFNVKWEKEFVPEKGFITVEAAQSGNDRFVVIQRSTPRLFFSRKAYAELVCFDDINGDILFKTPLYDDEITAVPSQILIDDEQNIIAAGEFFKGIKAKNVNSKGVFIKKLSSSGEELVYNKQTWKEGIQKQLKKTKMTISGKNKVYFHKLVQNEEGGYQIIGETFSSSKGGAMLGELEDSDNAAAQMAGMIANKKAFIAAALSGRYIGDIAADKPASTLTTQDFLLLDFNSDLELEEVRKVQKEYTKIYVYEPYTYVGGLKLSKVVADYGFFDFAFTGKVAGSDEEVIVYNASYSKHPHIGTFSTAKGITPEVKMIEFKEMKGDSDKKGKKKKGKKGQAGVAKSVSGKMLIYFFVKRDNKEKGKKNRKESGAVYMYVDDIAL